MRAAFRAQDVNPTVTHAGDHCRMTAIFGGIFPPDFQFW
jgi:hypothetical protein